MNGPDACMYISGLNDDMLVCARNIALNNKGKQNNTTYQYHMGTKRNNHFPKKAKKKKYIFFSFSLMNRRTTALNNQNILAPRIFFYRIGVRVDLLWFVLFIIFVFFLFLFTNRPTLTHKFRRMILNKKKGKRKKKTNWKKTRNRN